MVPAAPPLPPKNLPNSEVSPRSMTISKEEAELELQQKYKEIISLNKSFEDNPFFISWQYLSSQLQEGPKCGLVALSIASSCTESAVNVENLFEIAKSSRCTKNGEMFSAQCLATLANNTTCFKAIVLDGGLESHLACILLALSNNNLLLVPYDADYNHSPTLRSGHKAHWAIISGFVIFEVKEGVNVRDTESEPKISNLTMYDCCGTNTVITNFDESNNNYPMIKIFSGKNYLTLMEKEGTLSLVNSEDKDVKNGVVFLVSQHGKSHHLALWSFEELCKSNNNLRCFSPNRDLPSYILPDGGLQEGLLGKAIILYQERVS